jgi:hypothetical protein
MALDSTATFKREAKRAGVALSSFLMELSRGLRVMGQRIENDGVSAVVKTIATIVIAQIFIAIGAAAVFAYFGLVGIREEMNNGFCRVYQQLDEIRRPNQAPRNCDKP